MARAGSTDLRTVPVSGVPTSLPPLNGAAGLAERLPALVEEWRRLSEEGTLKHRLVRLLERLSPLLPSPTRLSLDAERLAGILPALSSALAQSTSAGDAINPWTIAGIKRREVRNAAILASLWTPAQAGDVAAAFLGEFFARCGAMPGRELPTRADLALGYRIRVENCPGADGSDRVDIVVDTARQLIGIEVKIDAGEGRDQLDRYVEAMRRNARLLGKEPRVIFLAPFASKRDDVIPADWSTVRAAAAAALPRSRSDYEFVHHLVAQFARHVRSF